MKCFSRILFAFVLAISFPALAKAADSKIRYSGGDGSSFDQAVVIKGATEETGVDAEYAYLDKHFPGYKMRSQVLEEHDGHSYDLLVITTAQGEKASVYFDITDFFGKFK